MVVVRKPKDLNKIAKIAMPEQGVIVMVFNATLNNISVILLWSVLLAEETRIPGVNHRPAASH
jgi:hypothetical protein